MGFQKIKGKTGAGMDGASTAAMKNQHTGVA
jgi:hypothetical protein